jgi:hypothetical protein
MHALATGYWPAYLSENADGIRGDWPRVPLPAEADALRRSAALGRTVAALLAYDPADASTISPQLRGVVGSPLRAEMRVVGVVSRAGGGQLQPAGGEYALDADCADTSAPRTKAVATRAETIATCAEIVAACTGAVAARKTPWRAGKLRGDAENSVAVGKSPWRRGKLCGGVEKSVAACTESVAGCTESVAGRKSPWRRVPYT